MFTGRQIFDLLQPVGGRLDLPDSRIARVVIDSRQITQGGQSIFVALSGKRTDGHRFVRDAWDRGVRNFITESDIPDLPGPCNVFAVENAIIALQVLAQAHRGRHDILCIGITGSNGKTWVKEWLYQLLHADYDIVKSPRSYNSQIGVPLSVLQIGETHTLGIFEAGLSEEGEMQQLSDIICPQIGVLTHLGDAHDAGFPDRETKLREKCKLFAHAHTVVYPADDPWLDQRMRMLLPGKSLIRWSEKDDAPLSVRFETAAEGTRIPYAAGNEDRLVHIPFGDSASRRNAATCIGVLLALGVDHEVIASRMAHLQPIEMRLEIHQLANQCLLVNDTYSLDLASLRIGLETLEQHSQGMRKALIITDIDQQKEHVYDKIAALINQRDLEEVHAIGSDVSQLTQYLNGRVEFVHYDDVDAFIGRRTWEDMRNTAYLLKGARRFGLERIVGHMQTRSHTAVLEVDLNAMLHNLQYFTQKLRPQTQLIAMVKAAAYGSGSTEVGKFLEFHNVDMLGVAYVDEGVELRKAGVRIPIMVMNADLHAAHLLIDHRLEPEVYDLAQLEALAAIAAERNKTLKVHLKVDTGMHRLGFTITDVDILCERLRELRDSSRFKVPAAALPRRAMADRQSSKFEVQGSRLRPPASGYGGQATIVEVASVFTHLAAAGNEEERDYSLEQVTLFDAFYGRLAEALGIRPLRHVLNSKGILQFRELQYEAVRLGIGLYGVGVGSHAQHLQPVHTLKARISQIHEVDAGGTVGYSRAFKAERKTRVATINAGYADGIMRAAGYGKYDVLIHGKRAPIVGTICMDMCMVDVTGLPEARPGDPVIVFGPGHSVEELAKAAGTIPYEVLTSISARVPRVFRFV